MANMNVKFKNLNFKNPVIMASGTFGFTTGEGLVNVFHGTGKVYIQSRNLHSLADALTPFIPQGKD